MPYCGAAVPESYSTVDYPDEFLLVDQPGLSTAETLGINSCSEIGEGTVDLAIRGVTNDRVIIFVLDMSLSMDTPIFPPGAPAVDLMKEKVAGDVLDTLHEAAMTLEGNNDRIHAALVTFNRNTWYYLSSGPGMLDAYSLDDEITESYFFDVSNDDGELDVLHDTIWNLDTWQETNILNGLNAAEMLISGADDLYPGADKTVVLLSDGHPIIGVITPYYRWTIWCDSTRDECSCGTGSPGDPIIIGQADSDKAVGTIQADNPDFSIAVTDPITECPYDYSQTPERIEELEGRHENGDCLESEAGDNCCNTWHFTRAYPTQECVITNVGAQADWIKSPSGGDANLYTIYYNTGSEGAEESERDMCLWSSEDDSLCDPYDPDANDYRFAFASSDVDALFDSVMDSIFNKPNGIYVNETTLIEDPDPRQVVTEKTLCINDPDNPVCEGSENISDVDCSMEELSGFFEQGQGELVFSNLHLDYCPAKLH
jgi:hypothetical protein